MLFLEQQHHCEAGKAGTGMGSQAPSLREITKF